MNSRELLAHIADWLGWQTEDLAAGLRTAFDALRLHDYAQAHPELPEMADEWEAVDLIAAVGYNPFAEEYHDSDLSGAGAALSALEGARDLLDSVAFVAKVGDKDRPLAAINAVLGSAAAVPEDGRQAESRVIAARLADGSVRAFGWDCSITRAQAKGWLADGLTLELITAEQLRAISHPDGILSTRAPVGVVLSFDQASKLLSTADATGRRQRTNGN